jgi:hypothetical protein
MNYRVRHSNEYQYSSISAKKKQLQTEDNDERNLLKNFMKDKATDGTTKTTSVSSDYSSAPLCIHPFAQNGGSVSISGYGHTHQHQQQQAIESQEQHAQDINEIRKKTSSDLHKLFEKKCRRQIIKSQSCTSNTGVNGNMNGGGDDEDVCIGEEYLLNKSQISLKEKKINSFSVERKEIKAKIEHKHMRRSKSWDVQNQTYSK